MEYNKKNKNPLVSVIIPMYNSEKYVAQTIESVLNQTYTNIEVIVIDDGSMDNSLEVAKRFVSDKVQIVHQEHSGAQVARNLGFRLSHGEYIQYLDADDMLSLKKIECQIGELLKYDEYTIATCSIMVQESSKKWEWRMPCYHNYDNGFDLLVDLWAFFAPSWCHACYLVPRRLIELSGGWDETLLKNQDGDFYSRILINTKKVVFVDGEYMLWRILQTSTSHKDNPRKTESVLRSYEKISNLLLSREDSERVRRAIAIAYGSFIINDSDSEHGDLALKRLMELGIEPNYRIRAKHFLLMLKFMHPQTAMKCFRFIQKCRGKQIHF